MNIFVVLQYLLTYIIINCSCIDIFRFSFTCTPDPQSKSPFEMNQSFFPRDNSVDNSCWIITSALKTPYNIPHGIIFDTEKFQNKKTTLQSAQTKLFHNDTTIVDDEVYLWSSDNYPEPYTESASVTIRTDPSYSISIEIKYLNLSSEHGDYLMIKSGADEDAKGDGKILTYMLKKPRKYFFHTNTVYIHFQVYDSDEEKNNGFLLSYQRIGEEPLTTTESPTTTSPWPTPAPNESNYFIGNLFGKTLQDFTIQKNIDDFKSAMVEASTEYCQSYTVTLVEPITIQNVLIHHIVQCPHSWPNSHLCTQVNFSLPIIYEENLEWKGYQINSGRLEDMWINYAGSYLDKYNMKVYSEPDNMASYMKWIIISCSVLAVLLLLLCIVTVVRNKFSPAKNRKEFDTSSTTELQKSQPNLGPSRYQPTPPIFENEHFFDEFDFDIQKPKHADHTDWLTDDISDDEVIVSQFANIKKDVDKTGFKPNTRPTDKSDWQTFQ